MPNYKPWAQTVQVGSNAYNVTVPIDDVVILFYNFALSTTDRSLADDDGSYVVPTGKTFRILAARIIHDSLAGPGDIYQGDTEDAITSHKWAFNWRTSKVSDEFPVQIDIAAGKYTTFNVTAANIFYVSVYGYLLDA